MNPISQDLSQNKSITQAEFKTKSLLSNFASDTSFLANIQTAFGADFSQPSLEQFQQQWLTGNFSFPDLEIRSAAELNGANGAFSVDTNKIYLSQELLLQNDGDAIASLLLEEYGHYVDSQINSRDALGDEGDIFSRLVQGEDLSNTQLKQLQTESDHSIATINGETIAIEQNTLDLSFLRPGLDSFFDILQNAVDSEVFRGLPLVGESLSAEFIEDLRNQVNEELDQLENPDPEEIAEALTNALGDTVTVESLSNDPDDCRFSLRVVSETETNTTTLDGDLGFSGLGNEDGLDLSLNASADTTTNYDFNLEFGVDNEGFYVDTSAAENELNINLDVRNLRGSGELGALSIDATDNNSDPSLTGTFNVNLTNNGRLRLSEFPSIDLLEGNFDIDTDLDLNLETTISRDTDLPTVGTDLNIEWLDVTGEIDSSFDAEFEAGDPEVSLDNGEVCLGTFFSNLATPVLETVQSITEPIEPVLNALTEPIDLGGTTINLLDIAKQISPNFNKEDSNFIESLVALTSLINTIPTNSDICIDLGVFELAGNIRVPDFNPPEVGDLPEIEIEDLIGDGEGQLPEGSSEANFYSQVTEIPGEDLTFPILDDPENLFNLLLGNYDLVEFFHYDLPQFQFDAVYSQFIPLPPFPVVGAELRGSFGAAIDLEFGFNGSGIETFNFLDGLFVDGSDDPELTLSASIEAEPGVDFGVISGGAGVGGGIYGNVNFNLQDPNQDGRVTLSELQSLAPFDPNSELDVFETSGQLSAGLYGFVRVDLFLASYTRRFEGPRVVLLDFEGGENVPEPTIQLGTLLDDGVLRLNMGANAGDRNPNNSPDIDAEDGAEAFSLIVSSRSSSTYSISAFDEFQRFTGVSRIVADAGNDDDLINLEGFRNLRTGVPAELSGGNGDDELIGGSQGDILNGDAGFDRLDGGAGADSLNGGAGDDFLTGGIGADMLNGGDGDDIATYATSPIGISLNLTTGEGTGHAEGDVFQNIEQIAGSRFGDTLIGSQESDRLDGAEGNDSLDGSGGDDILLPDFGDDTVSGGEGDDILVIDYSALPTGAVVWREGAPDNDAESTLFVGNAYGLDTPRVQLREFQGGSNDGQAAISEDGTTVAWVGQNSEDITGVESRANNIFLFVQQVENPDDITIIDTSDIGGLRRNDVSISDDGSKIAWTSANQKEVYVANADGTNITRIVNADEDFQQLRAENPEIPDSGNPVIDDGGGSTIQLSGDGSKIIWTVNLLGSDAGYVAVANTDGTELNRSPFVIENQNVFIDTPSISADGSRVVWSELSPRFRPPNFGGSIEKVFTANSDFSDVSLVAIGDISSDVSNPSISADGSTVAFDNGQIFAEDRLLVSQNNSTPTEVFSLSLEEGRIVGATGGGGGLSLSPDGERIAFISQAGPFNGSQEPLVLNVVDADGTGNLVQIPTNPNRFRGASIFPESLSSFVDIGVRYESFDAGTGSGEIVTWGPSHIQFDSIERFDFTGTIYGDDLRGGNGADLLKGAGGADTLRGAGGDDIYELDPSNAAGSEIEDTGGNDSLRLVTFNVAEQISANPEEMFEISAPENVAINLAQPAPDTTGLTQDGTSLIIDIDRDGIVNPEQDLTILNFFDANGSGAGTGFIENVVDLNGDTIVEGTAILELLGFDSSLPEAGIADVTLNEDSNELVFTVSLSEASSETVSLDFATEDGSAVAGKDYVTTSGTLEFTPGETEQAITVEILGDDRFEPNEEFNLNLSNSDGVALVDNRATGIIANPEVAALSDTGDTPLTAEIAETDDSYLFQGETYFYDFFALPVDSPINTGDIVNLTLTSEDFDPILMILDSEGNVLEVNDNAVDGSTGAELTFVVGAEESFFVSVETRNANQLGNYDLTVNTVNIDNPNFGAEDSDDPLTAVNSIQTAANITGSLSESDIQSSVELVADDGSTSSFDIFEDNYLLTGTGLGHQVQISLQSDEFDGEINILEIDASGNITPTISQLDVAEGVGTTETFTLSIEEDTNYIINVTGGTGNPNTPKLGNYSLTTELI